MHSPRQFRKSLRSTKKKGKPDTMSFLYRFRHPDKTVPDCHASTLNLLSVIIVIHWGPYLSTVFLTPLKHRDVIIIIFHKYHHLLKQIFRMECAKTKGAYFMARYPLCCTSESTTELYIHSDIRKTAGAAALTHYLRKNVGSLC